MKFGHLSGLMANVNKQLTVYIVNSMKRVKIPKAVFEINNGSIFFKCCIQSLLYESKLLLDLYIKQLCILFYAMERKSVFILTEKNNQQKMSFLLKLIIMSN